MTNACSSRLKPRATRRARSRNAGAARARARIHRPSSPALSKGNRRRRRRFARSRAGPATAMRAARVREGRDASFASTDASTSSSSSAPLAVGREHAALRRSGAVASCRRRRRRRRRARRRRRRRRRARPRRAASSARPLPLRRPARRARAAAPERGAHGAPPANRARCGEASAARAPRRFSSASGATWYRELIATTRTNAETRRAATCRLPKSRVCRRRFAARVCEERRPRPPPGRASPPSAFARLLREGARAPPRRHGSRRARPAAGLVVVRAARAGRRGDARDRRVLRGRLPARAPARAVRDVPLGRVRARGDDLVLSALRRRRARRFHRPRAALPQAAARRRRRGARSGCAPTARLWTGLQRLGELALLGFAVYLAFGFGRKPARFEDAGARRSRRARVAALPSSSVRASSVVVRRRPSSSSSSRVSRRFSFDGALGDGEAEALARFQRPLRALARSRRALALSRSRPGASSCSCSCRSTPGSCSASSRSRAA